MALRIALLVLTGVSAWKALRPQGIVGLHLVGKGKLECKLADGRRTGITLLPDCTVFTCLIVLRLRMGDEKRVRSLALLPDQMTADQFRMLRLWLRWQAAPIPVGN